MRQNFLLIFGLNFTLFYTTMNMLCVCADLLQTLEKLNLNVTNRKPISERYA